jgi:hypothetical protein
MIAEQTWRIVEFQKLLKQRFESNPEQHESQYFRFEFGAVAKID